MLTVHCKYLGYTSHCLLYVVIGALESQVYKANLDNQAVKESQASVVTLVPPVSQELVLYVSCMDIQVLQDLQETLDAWEYQVITQQQQAKLWT